MAPDPDAPPASTPVAAAGKAPRMLRVEVRGALHEWFDVAEMGESIRAPSFPSAFRSEIARYFGVAAPLQAIFDDDGLLATAADLSRALHHASPKLYVHDATELEPKLRAQIAGYLADLEAAAAELRERFGIFTLSPSAATTLPAFATDGYSPAAASDGPTVASAAPAPAVPRAAAGPAALVELSPRGRLQQREPPAALKQLAWRQQQQRPLSQSPTRPGLQPAESPEVRGPAPGPPVQRPEPTPEAHIAGRASRQQEVAEGVLQRIESLRPRVVCPSRIVPQQATIHLVHGKSLAASPSELTLQQLPCQQHRLVNIAQARAGSPAPQLGHLPAIAPWVVPPLHAVPFLGGATAADIGSGTPRLARRGSCGGLTPPTGLAPPAFLGSLSNVGWSPASLASPRPSPTDGAWTSCSTASAASGPSWSTPTTCGTPATTLTLAPTTYGVPPLPPPPPLARGIWGPVGGALRPGSGDVGNGQCLGALGLSLFGCGGVGLPGAGCTSGSPRGGPSTLAEPRLGTPSRARPCGGESPGRDRRGALDGHQGPSCGLTA